MSSLLIEEGQTNCPSFCLEVRGQRKASAFRNAFSTLPPSDNASVKLTAATSARDHSSPKIVTNKINL